MRLSERTGTIDRCISIRELACEFDSSRQETRKWLMLNDFSVERRNDDSDGLAVLTATEADQARYLKQHGVLLTRVHD